MTDYNENYSGRDQYYLRLRVTLHSQSGNSSRFSYQLAAVSKSGYGSWTATDAPYSVSIGGSVVASGSANLDMGPGSNDYTGKTIVLTSGTTGFIAHNSAGYLTVAVAGSHGSLPTFGSASPTGSFVAPRIPKAPAAPTLYTPGPNPDQITATSFRYRFSGGDNGGSAIIEWQAQVATDAAYTDDVQTVSSSGTTVFTGRPPGVRQYARARGRNAVGWGAWGAVGIADLPGAAPSAPLNVLLITTPPDTINVDWDAPTNTGGKAITGYDVQRARDSNFSTGLVQTSVAGDVTEANLTGLEPAVTYWIRVRAKNADAVGAWSTVLSTLIPAGSKVWTGAVWKAAVWRVWTGSLHKAAIVKVWNGTDWVLAK
ncbi:minor tail protein [Microbacterium phage ValentiniPuff]|uniref:Minor tail protein n=1 Tax=Microbacterium phage ValentiniPuff TaxID=2315705 RepID=A0A386KP49_9CAUD|nr:minor tail protein [Microbacterium phage ValentiniPuff]